MNSLPNKLRFTSHQYSKFKFNEKMQHYQGKIGGTDGFATIIELNMARAMYNSGILQGYSYDENDLNEAVFEVVACHGYWQTILMKFLREHHELASLFVKTVEESKEQS